MQVTEKTLEDTLRQHIKVDATGLSPAVASAFVTGFAEAASAIINLLSENQAAEDQRAEDAIQSAIGLIRSAFTTGHGDIGKVAIEELAYAQSVLRQPALVEVAIKPLEWRDVDGDIVNLIALARTPFDIYFIERDSEGYVLKLGSTGLLPHPTLEAAKAAAQSDYEQRIRSALVDVPVEPVDWLRSCRITYLSGEERDGHVVTNKHDPRAIPVYISPPLSHRGEDSGGADGALAFVARWAWREDPPNAVRKLSDAERLSAIKHHPTVKAIAATRSGSATTASGGGNA